MSSKFDDEEEELSYQYKVILLGDGAVGKTSIATRFASNAFSQNYKQTVGVDFFIKRINLEKPLINITLQLWDIGGQSIGSKMVINYIAGADAVLLCYDITNYESFANLEDWYRLVLQTFKGRDLPYIALLGNKNDLKHMTAVRLSQHSKFAEENEMSSFQMSAKNGDHVTTAFWKVAAALSGVSFLKFDAQLKNDKQMIAAIIVDHKQHDEEVNEGKVPDYTTSKRIMSSCSIS